MVSIRRRRNLGLCTGAFSLDSPIHKGFENELDVRPDNVHHSPTPETDQQKENNEAKVGPGSSNPSGSSSSKEQQPLHNFPEVKRRKRHRRKHFENQEPCIMRGVYFKNMKWQAAIKVDKKQIHLGTVGSQEEAARLYDRAAFMCGREPNFELTDPEKHELRKLKWEDFLALTRSAITNKKHQRRTGAASRRKIEASTHSSDWEAEQAGSEDLETSLS